MGSSLKDLASSLYEANNDAKLHHYTSIDALLGIVHDGALWATGIQYFSDASELSHAVWVLRRQVDALLGDSPGEKAIHYQLATWLPAWIGKSTTLYVVCFTEEGDLLSQWRGYTPHGRGVCIQLRPTHVNACAKAQDFDFVQCIYDEHKQHAVALETVKRVIEEAKQIGPDGTRHADQSYFTAFEQLLPDLLRIAVAFKHPSFAAEKEWRAVHRHNGPESPAVRYRAGRTTLVPYVPFNLVNPATSKFELHNVFVGPTPHTELSIAALRGFVGRYITATRYPVMSSTVPYRET